MQFVSFVKEGKRRVARGTTGLAFAAVVVAFSVPSLVANTADAAPKATHCTPSFQKPENGTWSGSWASTGPFFYSGTLQTGIVFGHRGAPYGITGGFAEAVTADPHHFLMELFGTEPPLPYHFPSSSLSGTVSCTGVWSARGATGSDTFNGTIAANGTSASGTYETLGTVISSGQTIVVDSGTWTAAAVPAIKSLSPNHGPVGAAIAIKGSGFKNATSVHFGTQVATITRANHNGTSLRVVVPSGTGTVLVTVTTPNGTSATSSAGDFRYS